MHVSLSCLWLLKRVLCISACGGSSCFLKSKSWDSKTGDVQQSPPGDCTKDMLSLLLLLFYLDVYSKVCAGF